MPDSMIKRQRRLAWAIALALLLGTVACYWPAQDFEYVSIDDSLYVYQNPTVQRGLTWAGAGWAFRSVEGGNWNPLVWLSHMLDCDLYKTAGGHHVTNVLLHVANVLLLFFVLRRMTGTMWRSALTAALFAWHPLHVESVAWVSERKDVLSTLFWLLTMWAYVRYTQARPCNQDMRVVSPSPPSGERVGVRGQLYYTLALVFFILGLMSKPMLVTLPVILLLMDVWPLNRIRGSRLVVSGSKLSGELSLLRAIVEKIPFLALSAGASIAALWAQNKGSTLGTQGMGLRLENAAVSAATYVVEFFWPMKLAVFYPYPEAIPWWRALGAFAVLAAISLGVIWFGKKRPYLAAGWLWFLVTLLPVIGLVQVGLQSMADRYTYVPYIGLGLMVSWGLAVLTESGSAGRGISIAAAVAGLAGCLAVTTTQLKHWRNNTALYEHALAVTSGNFIAHGNLGSALLDEGKLDEAVKEFQAEIRIKPKIAKPYNDLGKACALQGKLSEATEMFSRAAQLDPGNAQARRNLGNAWLQQGRVVEGLAEMKAGVALEPGNVEGNRRMADALIKAGKAAEATPYCEVVLKAESRDSRAHFMLAETYLAQKRFKEAEAGFKRAMLLEPEVPQVLNALAWIYATCPQAELRDGPQGVRLAEEACRLTKRQTAEILDTLAAAYAEAGQFEKAAATADETRALAEASHDTKLAETERQRAEMYRAGKAFHEDP